MKSEQQRIFLAVLLCTGIFVGWQLIFPPPAPPPARIATPAPVAQPHDVSTSPTAKAVPGTLDPAAVAPVPQQERPFKNSVLEGTFTNIGSGISHVALANYFETPQPGAPPSPLMLQSRDISQARIKWDMPAAPGLQFTDAPGDVVVMTGQSPGGWDLQVEITPRADQYALDYVVRARNISAQPMHAGAQVVLALPPHVHPTSGLWRYLPTFLAGNSTRPLTAVCDVGGKIHREEIHSIVKEPYDFTDGVAWAAIDREYFAVAVVPTGGPAGSCHMRAQSKDLLEVSYAFSGADLAPQATWEQRFTVYVGPKKDANLSAVSPGLTDVVDYDLFHIPLGFFLARPMVFLLNVFHGWVGSWGTAIIMLTVLVKLVLFPVTMKSQESTRRMQSLKPEMDAIKAKFANDSERQQMEQMKLFREKGVNPMGGCLVMLLQMPVWVALYRMLSNAVDLYQQSFLWLPDLTMREPFPLLALTMGGLTVLQQKLMPMAVDNAQARMMTYTMPIVFTIFMVALPSGLVLYSLVNIILTIIQQLAINKFASDSQGRT